jgi:penicillin amidase
MDQPTAKQAPAPRPAPQPLPRSVKRAAFVALVLFLLATILFFCARVYIHRALRASLPQIDGTLHIAGLTAPVTVIRDAHGTPHITAASLDDLAFAQGFVTAQDRLWQMDMLRRHAAGDLAEILGSDFIRHDQTQRILQLRNTADATVAQMPPGEVRYLADYSSGVNAFIAASSAHLPVEFRLLRYSPSPWQPRDCVLIGLMMVQDLTTEFPIKLSHEQLASRLPPELLADLYPIGSWRDHPPSQPQIDLTQPQQNIPDIPLDESQSQLHPPQPLGPGSAAARADLLALERTLALSTSRFACNGCRAGSNEWAVSGAHTASGQPLLANDMHLTLTIPGIWYMADLAAPTPNGSLHVTGVTLPGMPFVIAGHNQNIAWGFTNLGADVQDLYVEHLRNQQEYQSPDGAWHPLLHHTELIRVHHGSDVTLDVLSTAHGPIISPLLPHEQRPLSLSWTIYKPGGLDLPFLALDSATNWTEFCASLATFTTPSQNVIYADTAGHIGYHAAGRVPIRGSLDHPAALSPDPIADADHEWAGYIAFDQLPQAYDSPGGLLATANSRVTPDGYPYAITLDWEAPFRNERIWKQLTDARNLQPADMLALQTDIYSRDDQEMAQRFAYAIDHTPSATPQLHQAADLLRIWDGKVDMQSSAANIVSATQQVLWPLLLQPHLGAANGNDWRIYLWGEMSFVQDEIVVHQPARWLPPGYANWDAFLTAAVAEGLRSAQAPADLSKWPYGRTHRLEIEHPIFGSSPLLRAIADLPIGTGSVPLSGDTTTIKQIKRNFGPSQRFTADLSNLDNSTLNLVTGESGNILSPWFHDQWDAWFTGTTFRLPFTSAALAHTSTHTLTLLPK